MTRPRPLPVKEDLKLTSHGILGPADLPTCLSANWPGGRRSRPLTGTDATTLPTCLSANWPGSVRPFPDMTAPGTDPRCSLGLDAGSMEVSDHTEVQGKLDSHKVL